jgi:phosphate transport system substrate-binding protein
MTRLPCLVVVATLALATVGPVARRSRLYAEGQPADDPLAIVVHRSNSVDNLTRREVRRIFMLETQTWPSGRRITVVHRNKGQPDRAEGIRLICGLSENQYDQHVLLQTFRGAIDRGPREILSAAALVRFVFNVPGAIGYVPESEADDSVKVVRIDGLLPGDEGYPLVRGRVPVREGP